MCGSDGMRINGRNALACAMLLKDIDTKKPILIEPLPYLPIIKDLAVDQSDFFKKYEMTKPWLITQSAPPNTERLQSHADAVTHGVHKMYHVRMLHDEDCPRFQQSELSRTRRDCRRLPLCV